MSKKKNEKREKMFTRSITEYEITLAVVGDCGTIESPTTFDGTYVTDALPTQKELSALSEKEGKTVFVLKSEPFTKTYGIPISKFMEFAVEI